MWRAASLLLGLFSIWVAMATPVAVLDERMLTAHMVQHLLLMTIAPPLIWLGTPAHVWASSTARWALLRKFGKAAGNPTFCWLAATATLVGWHTPAAFRLRMQSGATAYNGAGVLSGYRAALLVARISTLAAMVDPSLPVSCDLAV